VWLAIVVCDAVMSAMCSASSAASFASSRLWLAASRCFEETCRALAFQTQVASGFSRKNGRNCGAGLRGARTIRTPFPFQLMAEATLPPEGGSYVHKNSISSDHRQAITIEPILMSHHVSPLSIERQTGVTGRLYSHGMIITPDVVWRLRGTIAETIVCHTHITTSGGVWLQVLVDEEPVVEEIYPDARSATSRAEAIRRHLIEKGWIAETAA
jgi:hypothetical protein